MAKLKKTTATRPAKSSLDWFEPLSQPLGDRLRTRDRHDATADLLKEQGPQAKRVERELNRLKAQGVRLGDYTLSVLRRRVEKTIESDGEAKRAGFPIHSRTT